MKTASSNPKQAVGEPGRVIRTGSAASLLCEIAWEICQQVGGIYTVLRSKAPWAVESWGDRYCLIGPYDPHRTPAEFEETEPAGPFADAVRAFQNKGFEIHHGVWLISGRPQVVLLNPASIMHRLGEIKYLHWEHHGISTLGAHEQLLDQTLAFGYLVEHFLRTLVEVQSTPRPIIAHFHEWMAASAIPELRRTPAPLSIVFTTHATLLGRHLAMHDPWFYDHLPFVNWETDSRRFLIEPQVRIERAAAHGAHLFTTLSEITAFECEHLLHRKPDALLPNGMNIERYAAVHEFQNLHRVFKDKISQFVMGHFFPSYTFDLDRTIYCFTSGRYEYRNKGFDLTLEAMARLNWRMKQQNDLNRTVVLFLVTKRPFRSINPDVLHSRAMLEEIRHTCQAIKDEIGEKLFVASASGQFPALDTLVQDYWRLRLRRVMYDWKTKRLPPICTHDLIDDARDEVINQLHTLHLNNLPDDPVKVVYHPDFIAPTDPLFGMDYDQFVRGCHLGIFPSYYEPWGYTAPECMARGIPAVTSDLAGFGTYMLKNMPDYSHRSIFVVGRRYASYDAAATELTNWLFNFIQLERRERIMMRNSVENASHHFDWHSLGQNYADAYADVLQRTGW